MSMAYWTCENCGHEALDYDEVDHTCVDEDGKEFEYEAQGDEACQGRDEDYGQER